VGDGKKKDRCGDRGLNPGAIACHTDWGQATCKSALPPPPLDALIIQSWHKERLRGIIRKFEK
jgi:hypothetical protein